jgi:hypothetical protein
VGSGQQNFDKRQKDFVSHNQKQLMNAVDYRYYVLIYEKSETWWMRSRYLTPGVACCLSGLSKFFWKYIQLIDSLKPMTEVIVFGKDVGLL